MLKNYMIVVTALLLSACAAGSKYEPNYTYNEILIVNNSKELITDVSISSVATGYSFSCANIAPLGICLNRTPRRRYQKSPLQIDWVFGNSARKTDEISLAVPAYFQTGLPLRAVLEISPQGEISAHFEQDSPMN
jgi:hypothetical protein